MTTAINRLITPSADIDISRNTPHMRVGLATGAIGLVTAVAVAIIGIAVASAIGNGNEGDAATLAAVGFGLNTAALAMLKLGIGAVLVGILIRLWIRVDSIKVALGAMKPQSKSVLIEPGLVDTEFGTCTVAADQPAVLPIHRMARTVWAPMLAMGATAVFAGLITSFIWAGQIETGSTTAAAWTQGLQFLGEGMILAGISFLLGSILGGLRDGGAEVQAALGVPVLTLRMPSMAKAFIATMVVGVMLSVGQFVGYVATTTFTDPATVRLWFSVLGPIRELGLGILLVGIALALGTIGHVLGFQFWRIRGIVATGK